MANDPADLIGRDAATAWGLGRPFTLDGQRVIASPQQTRWTRSQPAAFFGPAHGAGWDRSPF